MKPRTAPIALLTFGVVLVGPAAARATESTGVPQLPPVERSAVTRRTRLPAVTSEEQGVHLLPPTLSTLALFTAMRTTEAYLWPEPFAFRYTDRWPARYERAFTSWPKFDTSRGFMQWDGDRWPINVLGHGLLGSELYLRPRRCGLGWLGSLGFAAAASAVWEYGFEANGVQPSLVDLWYTPLSGLVFGEVRYRVWQAFGELENSTWRHVLQGTIDPIGEFSTGVLGAPC